MGLVYADIELLNGIDDGLFHMNQLSLDKVRKVKVSAMVDSGAYYLAINENVQTHLQLPFRKKTFAQLADGTIRELDMVGPVVVNFQNRTTSVDAMVLPDNTEVLLGAIPMEGMDVIINPLKQSLEVNPEHPDIPQFSLK
ncbi:MAG: retroviral-like aspartic protease family protein [Bacteroidota bacterium]|nr:retroviral-like aspartic protease family protein [Bacteroidota bacterium]